jgi:Iron-sulfur cluster binding domain of dihydroorotate dehydrogenase B
MRTYDARLTEIQVETGGRLAAWIDCPQTAIPAAGQYTLACASGDLTAALGTTLFRSQVSEGGFLAAPPIPPSWGLGTSLVLRGPLGRGFSLDGQRLALAALGDTVSRLLPLADEALQRGDAVTLFTGAPLPALPASIEVYPLSSLPEAHGWADCLAVDLPLEALPALRRSLALSRGERLAFPAQALIYTSMPCAGLAECGVCAVPVRGQRRYRLACKDGPVFDLEDLDW